MNKDVLDDLTAEQKEAVENRLREAELNGRIAEIERIIGFHNNDPSTTNYDVLTIARSLLNERLEQLKRKEQ